MAKQVNYEMQSVARAFVAKFPIGETVGIDQFDMFITDQGLATDPQTDDTKSQAYKGFIQERAAAKRSINTAAGTLNGESFQVAVKTAGVEYDVLPWSSNARNFSDQMGERIKKFSDNRFGVMKSLHNKAEAMLLEEPNNDDLIETHAMIAYMRTQGLTLVSQIRGLVAQYNSAADATEEEIRRMIDTHTKAGDLPAIEDKTEV